MYVQYPDLIIRQSESIKSYSTFYGLPHMDTPVLAEQ